MIIKPDAKIVSVGNSPLDSQATKAMNAIMR